MIPPYSGYCSSSGPDTLAAPENARMNRMGVRCSNALVTVNSMTVDEMFSAKPLSQK